MKQKTDEKREINFRVWTGKEMLFFDDLANWDWKDCDEWLKIKKVAVMQSTGLKDKNGKEIYEGDILKVPETGWANVHNVTVVFENGEFKTDFMNDPITNQHEIIGNIHQTKKV